MRIRPPRVSRPDRIGAQGEEIEARLVRTRNPVGTPLTWKGKPEDVKVTCQPKNAISLSLCTACCPV
jgi:hypothetical protein